VNHRFVGGTSPSASLVGLIFATFFLVRPARSAVTSAGEAALVAAPVDELPVDDPLDGDSVVLDVQPATRAAPAIRMSGLVNLERRVLRFEIEVRALSLIVLSLSVSMWWVSVW
jgi:hypothetical protein